jgi:hypothetical protein
MASYLAGAAETLQLTQISHGLKYFGLGFITMHFTVHRPLER